MKVLIVKIGAVGDVVMALSMLEAIDQLSPDAKVTWVCGKTVAPLVEAVGRVNEVIVVDDQKLLRGGKVGALAVLVPLWTKLLGRKYDLVLTGHSDPRYRLLSLTAQGSICRSFGVERAGPIVGRYHASEYARLVTGLDGPKAKPGVPPQLRIPIPPALERVLQAGKTVVAISPGGAKNLLRDDALRRWPLENYVQLAGQLSQKGFQVLLTGSSSDDWVKPSFKALPVTDLIGQTSLTDLVALYSRCQLVVTHDSGPLHLAITAGTKVVGLFGPTIPMEKVPRDPKVLALWGGEKLACRPCYDGKNYAACDNNLCMKDITVEGAYRSALKQLGQE